MRCRLLQIARIFAASSLLGAGFISACSSINAQRLMGAAAQDVLRQAPLRTDGDVVCVGIQSGGNGRRAATGDFSAGDAPAAFLHTLGGKRPWRTLSHCPGPTQTQRDAPPQLWKGHLVLRLSEPTRYRWIPNHGSSHLNSLGRVSEDPPSVRHVHVLIDTGDVPGGTLYDCRFTRQEKGWRLTGCQQTVLF